MQYLPDMLHKTVCQSFRSACGIGCRGLCSACGYVFRSNILGSFHGKILYCHFRDSQALRLYIDLQSGVQPHVRQGPVTQQASVRRIMTPSVMSPSVVCCSGKYGMLELKLVHRIALHLVHCALPDCTALVQSWQALSVGEVVTVNKCGRGR